MLLFSNIIIKERIEVERQKKRASYRDYCSIGEIEVERKKNKAKISFN